MLQICWRAYNTQFSHASDTNLLHNPNPTHHVAYTCLSKFLRVNTTSFFFFLAHYLYALPWDWLVLDTAYSYIKLIIQCFLCPLLTNTDPYVHAVSQNFCHVWIERHTQDECVSLLHLHQLKEDIKWGVRNINLTEAHQIEEWSPLYWSFSGNSSKR